MYKTIEQTRTLLDRIKMEIFGVTFSIRCEVDNKSNNDGGRLFLQAVYTSKCNKSQEVKEWHGRKYYLSDYMTKDEIVKTAYVAFESAVQHEVMEGFTVDGIVLFNPHINFEELLKVSQKEVKRDEVV